MTEKNHRAHLDTLSANSQRVHRERQSGKKKRKIEKIGRTRKSKKEAGLWRGGGGAVKEEGLWRGRGHGGGGGAVEEEETEGCRRHSLLSLRWPDSCSQRSLPPQ